MRHKVIWLTIGMIALWMAVMGGTIMLDFDRVQQSNQATAELEWTYICMDTYVDVDTGEYKEIQIIEEGKNFIGIDEISAVVIDEKGKALSEVYDSLEPIGNGYVRFENTPTGTVLLDEDGNNKRTIIGVLNDRGKELPKEDAWEILYCEEKKTNQTYVKQDNADDRSGAESKEDIDDADTKPTAEYHVAKGDRKYVGIKDSAGNWHIPPVFDKIELTTDQKYAVIKNSGNIGIAVLEK